MSRTTQEDIPVIAVVQRPVSPALLPPIAHVPILNTSAGAGPSQVRARVKEPENTSSPIAINQCERCVKGGKTCRGPVGSRCDRCKRLKQKCSNSNGAARGRHAAGTAPAPAKPKPEFRVALPGAAFGDQVNAVPQATGSAPARILKRPAEDGPPSPGEGRAYSKDYDFDSDSSHVPPAKYNKKRRTQTSSAIIANRVMKHVRELEETVKRLEDTYNTEKKRVDRIVADLTKDMNAFIDVNDRESSH